MPLLLAQKRLHVHRTEEGARLNSLFQKDGRKLIARPTKLRLHNYRIHPVDIFRARYLRRRLNTRNITKQFVVSDGDAALVITVISFFF